MKLKTYTLIENSCGAARDEAQLCKAKTDREVPTTSNQERNEKLAAHLAEFRDKGMEKSFPGTLPDDEIGAWALGQHYDLKTPLLDWTQDLPTSPAILLLSDWITLTVQTLLTDSFMH